MLAKDPVIFQQSPSIQWPTPAPIVYGTPLSSKQLNAVATVEGKFTYDPAAGVLLVPGQHKLSATFHPDDSQDYTDGIATVTLTVVPATPSVSLTATPNPSFIQNPVQLASCVTSPASSPTGTVSFLDGDAQLGSSSIAGAGAVFSTSALTLGTHSISAAYSGDSFYTASASNTIKVTLEDFTIALSGQTASKDTVNVDAGHTASYSLTMSPVGGAT